MGLLFFWEKPESDYQNVRATLRHLEGAVEIASQANDQLRSLLRKMTIEPPKLRVALCCGEVYHGQVGPTVNIIGLPVVEAARVAALKEEYERAHVSLLISRTAHNRGAEWRMWDAGDFQPCTSFTPKGLGLPLEIYSPK